MACVVPRPNGHHWVQFRRNKKKYTVRLGKCARKPADRFCEHVETLAGYAGTGIVPPQSILLWLATMDARHQRVLIGAGLVDELMIPEPPEPAEEPEAPPAEPQQTIGDLIDLALRRKKELLEDELRKPATIRNCERATDCMTRFWGRDRKLADIEPEITNDTDGYTAQDYRRWLKQSGRCNDRGLAESTVSRRCRRTAEFFAMAVRRGWIQRNPFDEMEGFKERAKKERNAYVLAEHVERAIDKSYDLELRLFLAFARYAAVRGQSEIERLTIRDFDFEGGIITIHTPKTEHHEDGEFRFMPFWPVIQRRALDWFDRLAPGTEVVFPTLTQITSAALSKRIARAFLDSGQQPPPRFVTNCRASCESDLFCAHPQAKVHRWIGHSAKVAAEHYDRWKEMYDARGIDAAAPEWCALPFHSEARPARTGTKAKPRLIV